MHNIECGNKGESNNLMLIVLLLLFMGGDSMGEGGLLDSPIMLIFLLMFLG